MYVNGELSKLGSDLTDNYHYLTHILTTFQSKKVFLSVMLTCVIPTTTRSFFEEITFYSQF